MSEIIKITKVNYPKEPGIIRAFVDIEVIPFKNFFIRSIKIFKGERGEWVLMPSEKFQDKEGKDAYAQYCGYREREQKDNLGKAVISALNKYEEEHPREQRTSIEPTELPF